MTTNKIMYSSRKVTVTCVCLLLCTTLLFDLAECKKTAGSSRKSQSQRATTPRSRPSQNHNSNSHAEQASLSYPNYNSKPNPPKVEPTHNKVQTQQVASAPQAPPAQPGWNTQPQQPAINNPPAYSTNVNNGPPPAYSQYPNANTNSHFNQPPPAYQGAGMHQPAGYPNQQAAGVAPQYPGGYQGAPAQYPAGYQGVPAQYPGGYQGMPQQYPGGYQGMPQQYPGGYQGGRPSSGSSGLQTAAIAGIGGLALYGALKPSGETKTIIIDNTQHAPVDGAAKPAEAVPAPVDGVTTTTSTIVPLAPFPVSTMAPNPDAPISMPPQMMPPQMMPGMPTQMVPGMPPQMGPGMPTDVTGMNGMMAMPINCTMTPMVAEPCTGENCTMTPTLPPCVVSQQIVSQPPQPMPMDNMEMSSQTPLAPLIATSPAPMPEMSSSVGTTIQGTNMPMVDQSTISTAATNADSSSSSSSMASSPAPTSSSSLSMASTSPSMAMTSSVLMTEGTMQSIISPVVSAVQMDPSTINNDKVNAPNLSEKISEEKPQNAPQKKEGGNTGNTLSLSIIAIFVPVLLATIKLY